MRSIVIIDNTILYTWKFLKEKILNVLTTKIEMPVLRGDGGVS